MDILLFPAGYILVVLMVGHFATEILIWLVARGSVQRELVRERAEKNYWHVAVTLVTFLLTIVLPAIWVPVWAFVLAVIGSLGALLLIEWAVASHLGDLVAKAWYRGAMENAAKRDDLTEVLTGVFVFVLAIGDVTVFMLWLEYK